jgi:PAS domain S-box-containing protein
MLDGFVLLGAVEHAGGSPTEYRVLDVNPAFEELVGIPRPRLLGLLLGEVLRDLAPRCLRAFSEAAASGQPARFEEYSAALEKYLEVVALPSAEGESAAILSDVTERRTVEEALRRERDFTKNLVENSPAFFAATDREGKVIMMNQAMLKALGYSMEEVAGRDYLSTFIPEKERDRVAARFFETIRRKKGLEGDNFVRAKDGRELLVEWRNNVVLNRAGEVEYRYGLGIDVTERRRLEEQIRQSQKMEAVGRLAGGVAHDFNNLLTAILGYSELALLRLDAADPLRRDLEEIRRAGERAASLTRQLLAFSRRQVLEPVLLDLGQVVLELQKMLMRILGEDVELEVRAQPGVGIVRADPGQVQQVVVNLAVNARDAMPQGGRLTIEVSEKALERKAAALRGLEPGRYAILTVSDTGHGIDEEVRAHLFEPFFTTKEVGKGTGLGLATVHGIVSQSGGHVEVRSQPGRGATFRVYFPRAAAPAERQAPPAPAPEPARGTETILVVEDAADVRALVREILTAHGYRVLEAADGAAALEFCRSEAPVHLLLTDLVMPGMGGRAVAERLSSCWPGLKVLFMSGYPDRLLTEPTGSNPAPAFLAKPFQPQELARKVRALLGG